jgi:hypothetical protein
MHALLEPEWLLGFHSCSVFENLSVIGECLVNMNTLAPDAGVHQIIPPPPPKKTIFSKTVVNKFI